MYICALYALRIHGGIDNEAAASTSLVLAIGEIPVSIEI